ncbi:hypothetical protein [Halomarina pelagica]|uniref:hypothetical protein n=1 Tax=Halomarina pelagica TaxID=2961599 RepID=UPI0020C4E74B|nr:hypothetical protein [Halomarina sp. BND7]
MSLFTVQDVVDGTGGLLRLDVVIRLVGRLDRLVAQPLAAVGGGVAEHFSAADAQEGENVDDHAVAERRERVVAFVEDGVYLLVDVAEDGLSVLLRPELSVAEVSATAGVAGL